MMWKKLRKLYRRSTVRDRSWDNRVSSKEFAHFLHENLGELRYQRKFELDLAYLQFTNSQDSLGRGYYGTVAEATLNITKQWPNQATNKAKKGQTISVAVKIPNTFNDEVKEAARQMLYDELKILCAVGQHPNIVTLIGAVTTKRNLYVVVEKCENNNLWNVLNSHRDNFYSQCKPVQEEVDNSGYLVPNSNLSIKTKSPVTYSIPNTRTFIKKLTTAHLLSFAWQSANGMKHLAEIKVIESSLMKFLQCVHRDLAARNILITSKGVCKVSDFGMARNIVEKEYYRLKSKFPLPIRWMAPEAIEKATVQSDVWSFGILLYEIFSLGEVPYANLKSDEVLEHVLKGERNTKPLHAHDEVYSFMKECWELQPDKRPCFKKASQLLESHLDQSSKKIYKSICQEISDEWQKQVHIAALREEAEAFRGRDFYFTAEEIDSDYIPASTIRKTLSSDSGRSTDSSISD